MQNPYTFTNAEKSRGQVYTDVAVFLGRVGGYKYYLAYSKSIQRPTYF